MSFDFKTINGVTFLSCRELEGAVHGFSTRLGGVSEGKFASMNLSFTKGDSYEPVMENHRRFAAAVGYPVERTVSTKQVHGDVVRIAAEEDCGKGLRQEIDYECDALMTNVPELPLMILTADCCPILLHDPVAGVVAAVHAGWRGTALGIAGKTAREMCRVYGCKGENIRAAIGPCVGQCCFETGPEVAEAMIAGLGPEADEFCRPRGEKFYVNLKGINRRFLEKAGVQNISVTDQCTACDTEKYFSHRRMGDDRGSLASVIMLPGVRP